jgi:hypothetical protein
LSKKTLLLLAAVFAAVATTTQHLYVFKPSGRVVCTVEQVDGEVAATAAPLAPADARDRQCSQPPPVPGVAAELAVAPGPSAIVGRAAWAARAGIGATIASQFPTDLPTPVAGSTATKLYFSQTNVEQIRDIQRTILGKTSGADADHLAGIMRGLPPLTCVLYSKQFPRFVRVTINPYFERSI